MHKIQNTILNRLSISSPLPYSKLKYKSTEGNVFTYHLNKLISQGFIIKSNGLYELTAKGKFYLGRISKEDLQPRIQPKIVTLIACTNDFEESLLYQRKKEPFIGMVGYPYGKIHLGESVQEAASRELEEKTGLVADLTHRGNAYLTIYQDGELMNQMLCHIFNGSNCSGEIKKNSSIGKCFWKKVTDPHSEEYFPGFNDITTLLRYGPKEHFFAEFTYNI